MTLAEFLLPRVEFLLARIAEDEAAIRKVFVTDPAHLLAECEAKRRIVELCRSAYRAYPATDKDSYFEEILDQLAAPYADHPDYDQRWRP